MTVDLCPHTSMLGGGRRWEDMEAKWEGLYSTDLHAHGDLWKWVGAVSESSICPPRPTILNIRQLLNEDLIGHGWSQQQWLLAYAHVLQCMGKAADGRTWRPNGKGFTPQISMLMETCKEELDDEETSWWLLVSPLTDGSNTAVKDITRHLRTGWGKCLIPLSVHSGLLFSISDSSSMRT